MKQFLIRLFGLDVEVNAIRQAAHNMADFVFEHAKFPDQSGKADGDYNSKEVEERWNKFHDLNSAIHKAGK